MQWNGYNEHARPKLVFLHPLSRTARARLRAAHLDPRLQHGVPKIMLTAARMRSLNGILLIAVFCRRFCRAFQPVDSKPLP